MNAPINDIATLEQKAAAELESVTDAAQLENWRRTYLGRQGQVSLLLRSLKDISAEDERRTQGQKANQLRQQLEKALTTKQYALTQSSVAPLDVTVPGLRPALGHLHPLTLSLRRIRHIFTAMGFLIVEGPLVEETKYNFDLLNMPLEHPARSELDTFYLTNGAVLRVHTSSVQVRAVIEHKLVPPFRIISPGLVFRAEKVDATHEVNFIQTEGVVVDKSISIAHFRGIIENFYTAFFGQPVRCRLRPSYFPFVEPGFEVDIACIFCQQKGCRVCKGSGWLEHMGAGMVHPQVLRNMNVDPGQWQGFAFGGGVERLAMLYYGINDVRLFHSGDLKFIQQFA